MSIDEIAVARSAFARNAWKDAYAGFRAVDEAGARLEAEDLERFAVCAYMVGKDDASAAAWARAHSEWLRLQNVRRAARCAFRLALDLMIRGKRAQAHGWHSKPGMSGIDVARELRHEFPALAIMLLTPPDPDIVEVARQAGIRGTVSKGSGAIVSAVQAMLRGEEFHELGPL